jgi:UDP-glucose 4-epimerase
LITVQRTPRILVTGGAGFIGSWLVEALLEHGFAVLVLDDLSTGCRENVLPSAELVIGDVLDFSCLAACCNRVDAVFHLAGVVGMRLAHAHKQRSYDIAAHSTEHLLDYFQGPVMLMSSSAIYGLTNDDAITENAPVTDDSVRQYDSGEVGYALGKWHMEAHGQRAAPFQPVLIVRPFNVVGPRQTGTYGMVVPTFVRLALAAQPLEIHDDGLQSRSFGHVATFVDALLRLAATPDAYKPKANVFNIGNDRLTTILDLTRAVTAQCGVTERWNFVPYSEVFPGRTDVRTRRPDTTALTELIGDIDWPHMDTVVTDVVTYERKGIVLRQTDINELSWSVSTQDKVRPAVNDLKPLQAARHDHDH